MEKVWNHLLFKKLYFCVVYCMYTLISSQLVVKMLPAFIFIIIIFFFTSLH